MSLDIFGGYGKLVVQVFRDYWCSKCGEKLVGYHDRGTEEDKIRWLKTVKLVSEKHDPLCKNQKTINVVGSG